MHYYQFNIADYRKDTAHLTRLEHSIYRELIDCYYLDEKPLETEWVTRRLRLETESEATALQNVFRDFFVEENGVFKHPRIDAEIAHYHEMSEKNRNNGKKGGRPKSIPAREKTQSVPSGNPVETEWQPKQKATNNQEPLTINQEPVLSKQRSRGTRLPDNWMPSAELIAWAQQERPDLNIKQTAEAFCDYWHSATGKSATKMNWDLTFKGWVRNQRQRAGSNNSPAWAIEKENRIRAFAGDSAAPLQQSVIGNVIDVTPQRKLIGG